jgi:hypothetical protein
MSWMEKARSTVGASVAPSKPGPSSSTSSTGSTLRVYNALKEFLWLTNDIPRARLLDLGPAWQSTITFFIEKGYRVTTDDLLKTWKDYKVSEEERLRSNMNAENADRISLSELADTFLTTALQYPEQSFHGVLAWDLFDYFDAEMMPRVIDRLFKLLHPGGSVLTLFHSRATERFQRYRVIDGQNIEVVAAPTLCVHARVLQNREIMDLFSNFRSSKTFVGRDQVREGLFLK